MKESLPINHLAGMAGARYRAYQDCYYKNLVEQQSRRCPNCIKRQRWVDQKSGETQFYCIIGNTTLDLTDIQTDFSCNHFKPTLECVQTRINP